ncbi:MAG: hypothetical protein J4215_03770 [Candidatus Diapherotrites archaeon]|uniref:Uncharacterized protein n=1 Tax=Candidatus Iainarchaeum sp. TaxID=3101447 RepID=A0A8T4L310_9ARCH|nr:hypothetical protein [Candidatus Diapherotrites archaeon]
MTTIVFDSSVLISITEKCFLKILQRLHHQHGLRFVIPQSVFEEAVHHPESIRRFELNAVRLKQAVMDRWIEVIPQSDALRSLYAEFAELSNNSFFVNEKPLQLLQAGELEALAVFKSLNADALAIDERTCRMMLEDPYRLQSLIARRMDRQVQTDSSRLKKLSDLLGRPTVVRSCDLLALAFSEKLFEGELSQSKQGLEAALWSVKFAGCAVSGIEITDFLRSV